MTRVLRVSPETERRQIEAADPRHSAWVSANAGSGKTTVLSHRVIRLLLAGVDPARILCLTFTKAAAANMSNRVFQRLAAWAVMPDERLRQEIAALGEGAVDAALMARARRLFARALDTPGGLKVLTIHGFCERVLHQFPFEANVPAGFAVLDERIEREMVARARDDVLSRAAGQPDGPLGRALARLIAEFADISFIEALQAMLNERAALAKLLRGSNAAEAAHRLARLFGLGPGDTLDAMEARILGEGIPASDWPELVAWLGGGSKTDNDAAACLVEALSTHDEAARRAAYLQLFFTGTGGPRRSVCTAATRKRNPALAEWLEREQARLVDLHTMRNAAATVARTEALLTLADAVRVRYEREKAMRGALDFADLIAKTASLLRRDDTAWVLYKLDGGLDHVLVDEAQDTSPEQWEIVSLLTAEFTAGAGARAATRTIFAVGDEKQSIFGFQGAAPEEFGNMRRRFERSHGAAGLPFAPVQLTQSFRSTEVVLQAVDRVFSREIAFRGLTFDPVRTHHDSARPEAPGRVEIWPLVAPPPPVKPDRAWDAPFDVVTSQNPVALLAERIAGAVRGWTEGRDPLGASGRVAPGDVLILVRTRGPLFEAILRALKRRGVPIAGADRLDVGRHIAVLDCLALGDALTQPGDDLALACVLKSPLFGFDEDALMRLAANREGSLRAALAADPDPRCRDAEARLARWEGESRVLAPFDFYGRVLGRDGGRRAFRRRLGAEVDDPLDEMLRLALAQGESEPATLSGFLAWMRADAAIIKRDLDVSGRDEVRVMTVHGAKGLEAKVVILADFGEPATGRTDPKIFALTDPSAAPDAPKLLAWSQRSGEDPLAVAEARAAARARAEAERRRLLYVALTRAEDRLVVAGHCRGRADGSVAPPPDAWYSLVRDALDEGAETVEVPELGGGVIVLRGHEGAPEAPADRTAVPEPAVPPPWLLRPVPAAMPAAVPLTPSGAFARAGGAAAAAGSLAAIERGTLIHGLLQVLAPLAPDARAAAGAAHLAELGGNLAAASDLLDEALAALAAPVLAPLWSAPARVEVPVAGLIERPGLLPLSVSGRIDRLVLPPGEAVIVDFKTDRPAPAVSPASYVAQLALYAELIRRVFPDRQVRTALLWTAGPRLDEVAPEALAAALRAALA